MRTPSELFGLMAYLFVMYGGMPDRELLSAAYNGDLEAEPIPDLSVISPGKDTRPSAGPLGRSRAA